MKKSILKLGKVLSRENQKQINGGRSNGCEGQPGQGHPGPEGEDRPCDPNVDCNCNNNSSSGFTGEPLGTRPGVTVG